jgi:hypothetical protein
MWPHWYHLASAYPHCSKSCSGKIVFELSFDRLFEQIIKLWQVPVYFHRNEHELVTRWYNIGSYYYFSSQVLFRSNWYIQDLITDMTVLWLFLGLVDWWMSSYLFMFYVTFSSDVLFVMEYLSKIWKAWCNFSLVHKSAYIYFYKNETLPLHTVEGTFCVLVYNFLFHNPHWTWKFSLKWRAISGHASCFCLAIE